MTEIELHEGQRVRAIVDLSNPRVTIKKGHEGVVQHSSSKSAKTVGVLFDAVPGRNYERSWSTIKAEIETFFKVGDYVCSASDMNKIGVVTDITPDSPPPYWVDWSGESGAWENAVDLRNIREDGKPKIYGFLKVDDYIRVKSTGETGTISEVDLTEDPIYVVSLDDGSDHDYGVFEIEKIDGKAPPKKDRIPTGTEVVTLVERGTVEAGSKGVVVRDDRSCLPYEVRFNEGGFSPHWYTADELSIGQKADSISEKVDGDRIAVGTVVKLVSPIGEVVTGTVGKISEDDGTSYRPYLFKFFDEKEEEEGSYWVFDHEVQIVSDEKDHKDSGEARGRLFKDDCVEATADLDFAVRQGFVGRVVEDPDSDGDIEISWGNFTGGSSGSGRLGTENNSITYVSLAEQARLKKISPTEFERKKNLPHKGDKFKVVKKYMGAQVGMVGEYIRNSDNDSRYLLRFDGFKHGHYGSGEGPIGSTEYYFVEIRCLERVEEEPVDTVEDKMTKWKPKIGDWVVSTRKVLSLPAGSVGRVSQYHDLHDLNGNDMYTVFWKDFTNGHHGDGTRGPDETSGLNVELDAIEPTFGDSDSVCIAL